VFDEIAAEYPDIENEHWIVDIGAAKMADTPQNFDVIVLPNLYGDILSDVAAQIAGSVGLAGSSNIGQGAAMFEAIHGSAPRRAGQNLANPSGLLLAGVMLLVHVGLPDSAELVHNAWLRTIEDGVHTYDIFREGTSRVKVGTREFAEAVAARLGQQPETLPPVSYADGKGQQTATSSATIRPAAKKDLVGVDMFVHFRDRDPQVLGKLLEDKANGDGLALVMISNRGQKVYPGVAPETFCTDHWRCRFMAVNNGDVIAHQQIISLLERTAAAGIDFIKTENLYMFDGEAGFSLGQGQ
jgi:isocitrate dehydrogenase